MLVSLLDSAEPRDSKSVRQNQGVALPEVTLHFGTLEYALISKGAVPTLTAPVTAPLTVFLPC